MNKKENDEQWVFTYYMTENELGEKKEWFSPMDECFEEYNYKINDKYEPIEDKKGNNILSFMKKDVVVNRNELNKYKDKIIKWFFKDKILNEGTINDFNMFLLLQLNIPHNIAFSWVDEMAGFIEDNISLSSEEHQEVISHLAKICNAKGINIKVNGKDK